MNSHGLSPQMNELVSTFEKMPWSESRFYKNWLAQSFYYTRHSTRMLAFAAGWTTAEDQPYYRRSVKHIQEEQNHEILAVRDLESLGSQRQDFRELGVTRALWEAQFTKIQRCPSALLGYILALEELAVKTFPKLCVEITKHYGPHSVKFVKVHAEDDPEHVSEAMKQIEMRSDLERAEIVANYDQTCDLYRLLLQEIQSIKI